MKRNASAVFLGVALLALLLPLPSYAGCTATVSCNNACRAYIECPPYGDCTRSCFAASTSATCSGTSVCTVGTGSVTCDGVTYSCPTYSQCETGYNYVQCGSKVVYCPNNCPV